MISQQTNIDKSDFDRRAAALLRRFYGYSEFRPGQLEIIRAVAAEKRDALVLMPTGGGKSMCYQLPALLSDGCAVVVSPLIALMHDQVSALVANGIPAATVNSNIDEQVNMRIMDQFFAGRVKLLYISPERLLAEMDHWPATVPVSLIAIDEAHCISQWGHDFRPVYTKLSHLKNRFPDIPLLALTATADRLTRSDIAMQLGLRSPLIWTGSFDRPNLSLKVLPNPGKTRRIAYICDMIDRHRDDAGIVYSISRKATESLHDELVRRGYKSVCYHAGMSAEEREASQRKFINGDAQVVCATVAFGMGIDKSNIRWVIHANLPANIESYYQEIGRAGRDGMPAETILFYSFADIATRRSFIEESGQPMLNLQKLNRMKEYAEAPVCRRRILLNYFGEHVDCDCGNCDVCLDPPERFDGTILVQKALSAIIRTQQKVGALMLIDILRGSARTELVARGFDKIKTYGVGRDMSFAQWNAYLSQMLQLGFIDIAYEDSNRLRVTASGLRVLKGETSATLARFVEEKRSPGVRRKHVAETGVPLSPNEELLSLLKAVRRKVADAEGVPAYIVFSDATLADMSARRPRNTADFTEVHGVGERKTKRYWLPFVNAIREFDGLAPFVLKSKQ